MSWDLDELVISRTLRLPGVEGPEGSGEVVVRQFDAVMMSVGFKLSGDLIARLAGLTPGAVLDIAVRVLPIVRRMAGAHVEHNVYFKDFPANVPDTVEFWTDCLLDTLGDERAAAAVSEGLAQGVLNLLALPR
ncbi:hypothetical protein [Nocardia sp. NPDC004711]